MASRFTRDPADPLAATTSERDALLRAALTARSQAEAARARAEEALRDAEAARAEADATAARHACLARAGRAMGGAMDLRATLPSVARAAVPVLADWCAITLAGPDGGLDVVALADPGAALASPGMAAFGVVDAVRAGQPVLLSGADCGLTGSQALLAVPLTTEGAGLGAVTFGLTTPERRFAPEDARIAGALAIRVGLHVHTARLYRERSHIARTLQRSLLPPQLPRISGVELAAGYCAAGAQHEVGGDFYDAFPVGDDEWTVVIGDVCGKGAEAAALTALTRHTLFAASLRGSDPLAAVLLANDALLARGGGTMRFATLALARVRALVDGSVAVRLLNAGHPPPFVMRGDGGVEETRAVGAAIGLFPDPAFALEDLVLAPGELLLLYTDGLTELRTADVDFGVQELRGVLAERAGSSAAAVVDAVSRHALDLQSGQPRDDVAAVALRAAPDRTSP